MEQPVVIVPGTESGDGGGDASFAAGVAAATAATAAADAQEAESTAEAAQETADVAIGAAYDAQADVAGLREEVRAGFGELRDLITGVAIAAEEATEEAAVAEEESLSPEETAEPEPAKPVTEEKSRATERKWGSDAWFGKR